MTLTEKECSYIKNNVNFLFIKQKNRKLVSRTDLEIVVYEMQYKKIALPGNTHIECVPFESKYFEEYKKIYNECFYDMRKSLDIKPYNFLSSYEQISEKAKV